MKFLTSALALTLTLAIASPQTGNAKIDGEIETVKQDYDQVKPTAENQKLVSDKKNAKDTLKADLIPLKENADFQNLKADMKAARKLAKANGVHFKQGTPSGNAEVDAAFAKVSAEKDALAAKNSDFKKYLTDKETIQSTIKADQQALNATAAGQKLQVDRKTLNADAKAAGINLHKNGTRHHRGANNTNANVAFASTSRSGNATSDQIVSAAKTAGMSVFIIALSEYHDGSIQKNSKVMAETKMQLGNVKDDDEFEDFQETDWDESREDPQDDSLWLEDWEEDGDDEFTNQLRAELQSEKK